MKKIVFLFLLTFISHNLYAQSNEFETYKTNNEKYNEYISTLGFDCTLQGSTFFGNYDAKDFYIYSNACAKIYETTENDFKKAYNKFLTTLETGFGTALLEMLPKTLPAKNTKIQKDNTEISFNITENKIQIIFIKNGLDCNFIIMKKDGKTIVADFTFMNDRLSEIDISKTENAGENIKKLEIGGLPLGKNLKHITTGTVIKNAYSVSEASVYSLYILNTTDVIKAYNIIRDYFNKVYAMEFGENYFPAYSQDKIKKLNNMYEMSDGDFNTFYLVVEKDHIKAYTETNIN